MAELLHPGVYVNIVSSGVRPIEGVGTSTAAFVGEAERGIPGRATFLTSYREYERAFGGQASGSRGYLAQAVEAFFRAGGVRAYAVRVVPSSATIGSVAAAQRTRNTAAQGQVAPKALSFAAKGKGAWSTNLRLTIEEDAISPEEGFRIRVFLVEDGVTRLVEDFQDLRMDPAAERYVADVIERESSFVTVKDEFAAWLDAGKPAEGQTSVTSIAASAPKLVTKALSAGSLKIHEGAELEFAWWDATAETRPDPVKVTFTNALRLTANKLLDFEDNSQSPPVIAAFSNGSTTVGATELSALLRAAAPKVCAVAAVTTPANVALGQGKTLPAGATDAAPDASKTVPVTTEQLDAVLTAAGQNTVIVGSVLDVTTSSGVVTVAAPFTETPNLPTSVESFDVAWISVLEKLQPGVGRVLPSLGLPFTKARGYAQNSPANPIARPLTTSLPLKFTGGTDGGQGERPSATDFLGDAADGTGLHALDRQQVNLVAVPGRNDTDVLAGAIAYCDARGDCFYIADGPGAPDKSFDCTAAEARGFIEALPVRSNNAAMYFPWIQEPDPVGVGKNPKRFVPPSGLVAGIYARTDRSRGVWKAPAGIESVVSGAVGVQIDVGDADQDLLNPVGLNCVRLIPGAGVVLWGARSLASDPEWRYVPVRRTALFLKESIRRGMLWAVFEPNDETLWSQIELNIHAFMLGLFRQGAFQGTTPEEAFLVQCDRDTNPQELVDAGVVTARVQFAPLKPAEFVVIEISQKSLVGGS